MSLGYRVVVEPLRVADRHVQASDEMHIALQLLPILGAEAMADLLKAALAAAGYTPTADGGMKGSLPNGVVVVVDKDASTVTVSLTSEKTVQGSARGAEAAERAADAAAERAHAAVKRDATTALAAAEADVRASLETVIQQVYVQALEQKAHQLGQVESMQQTEGADGSLEVTIKIRT